MNDKSKDSSDLKAIIADNEQVQAGVNVSTPDVDPLNLVDEHEEEVSINGKTERHKGIYLLPNLFTTAALFSGFYAVVSGMNGHFEAAAIAIFVSMVLDGLDGRVARMTNTQSKFGAEYDSLADMVSFGVAPAFVMFSWALSDLGKFGWATAFIYVACAALRLARFNTQIDTADKNFFSGLSSPAAAAVVAGLIWVCFVLGYVGDDVPIEMAIMAGCLTAAMGILMVSNVPYNSFKGFDVRGRVPFVMMVIVILLFGLITLDPARILLLGFFIYALSGPLLAIFSKLKRR
jgi:CDP-diacylglycerol--serine O-phosphatidyltransferase